MHESAPTLADMQQQGFQPRLSSRKRVSDCVAKQIEDAMKVCLLNMHAQLLGDGGDSPFSIMGPFHSIPTWISVVVLGGILTPMAVANHLRRMAKARQRLDSKKPLNELPGVLRAQYVVRPFRRRERNGRQYARSLRQC